MVLGHALGPWQPKQSSWTVASGWGDLVGLKGSGTLTGIVVSDVLLDDIYTGTVR